MLPEAGRNHAGDSGTRRMSAEAPLKAALEALDRSLAALESAVEARLDEEKRRLNLDAEMQRVSTDRSKLAQSLDASEARASRLETANREVARRLVTAMETIRAVTTRTVEAG